jgi:hypothetical protein
LALITSFFTTFVNVYLIANLVSDFLLLVLGCSLPTKDAPIPSMVLLRTKVKIGRVGSYLSVFIGAIFAIITGKRDR